MNEFPEGGRAGRDDGMGSGWHSPVPPDHPAAALLSAEAVRTRCAVVTDFVASGESELFTWHPDRVHAIADYVAATIRRR